MIALTLHDVETEDAVDVFGPNWRELREFEKALVEAVAESDSEFDALLRHLREDAETESDRNILDCLEHLTYWMARFAFVADPG